MTARIPGIEGEIGKPQFFRDMSDAAAVLVAPVEQNDRTFRRAGTGRPEAIEQFYAIMARKAFSIMLFPSCGCHCHLYG